MKYLKLFESSDNEDKTYSILYRLGNLIIDQTEEYVENGATHPTLELASELFSAREVFSILFGSENRLVSVINGLFGDLDEPARVNIKTMEIELNLEPPKDRNYQAYFYHKTAYRLLKYCDDDNKLKSQLSNWEEIEKYMEEKWYKSRI
jgi:hypothetical protein